MDWLNYHHLLYFWMVVRHGSITRACEELRLAPPTVSAQLRNLEEQLGEKLLQRVGRNLVPTEIGRLVYTHADEIFSLGQQLMDRLRHRPSERPLRLVVGVDDVLPKEIARRLIEPALRLRQAVRLLCHEAGLERLVAELAIHELDVVLSDAPVTPSLNVRVYNHLLGECGVSFMAATRLARKYRPGFPQSLNGAPVLLPTDDTAIRRSLDLWLDSVGVRPILVAEFEDYALLRVFARAGEGVFPVPAVLEQQFRQEDRVERIGPLPKIRARFYAITAERKLLHPAVAAICAAAPAQLSP